MTEQTAGRNLTARLYVKLSAILVPTFLVVAGLGVYLLTERQIDDATDQLGVRIGNAAARVASGLERLADEAHDEAALEASARELLQILMADPAIQCVELHTLGGMVIAEAPSGMGCGPLTFDSELVLPLYFVEEADLIVHSSLEELMRIRTEHRLLAVIMLAGALLTALVTNWISFRIIIGKPLRALIAEIDTARRQAEHSALHDSLTGLANRRYLDEELSRSVEFARRGNGTFAVFHLDLDHFKEVNDTMGHAAGDAVLVEVAKRLRETMRTTDFVARTGGDEFVIIAPGLSEADRASTLADRIISVICAPMEHNRSDCSVGASIGVELVSTDADASLTAERVLMNADIALYRAKALGRRRHVFFDTALQTMVDDGRRLGEELLSALKNGEIVAHYQSQHDPITGTIRGVEALARWQHPTHGLLSPEAFLPTASRLGVLAEVDATILRQAIGHLKMWDGAGFNLEALSVNVSAERLNDPDLVSTLQSMDLPHGRLVFEILETAVVDELSDEARWTLDALSDLGIEIEVDDFGTGTASILGVLALAPARLKIAREIIEPITQGPAQLAVLRAILSLGQSLGVGLIAEGVATADHHEILRTMGFEKLQGFYLSRPVDAEAMTQVLASQQSAQILKSASTGA